MKEEAGGEALASLDGLHVEEYGDRFVASDAHTGALSALSSGELVALHIYSALRRDRERARDATAAFLRDLGSDADEATRFVDRLEREGWSRTRFPERVEHPLAAIYFTVTRRCNLSCPYCYQGLAARGNTLMSVADAASYLDQIRAVNAGCRIVVTGGEPFQHPQILDILRLVSARGFPFVILSNGTCIDDDALATTAALPGFLFLQLSVDGMSEATHALTRGRGTFARVMETVARVIAAGIPFVLAPTMHSGNVGDIPRIAEMAVANGGWCSPNNLRTLGNGGALELTSDQCLAALQATNATLQERFGTERLAQLGDRYARPAACEADVPNANFRCGIGYSLLDLDWNGDVYPCHLAKSPDLVLGNLRESGFETLFRRAEERGMRVAAHEIPKCSACAFVSTCGGGCRAAAWFAYGSMRREDDQCELLYRSSVARLLAQ